MSLGSLGGGLGLQMEPQGCPPCWDRTGCIRCAITFISSHHRGFQAALCTLHENFTLLAKLCDGGSAQILDLVT